FNYVLQNEGGTWDVATVQVSNNGGASFTTVASSTNTAQLPPTSIWKTASFNLSSYAGQTILLRFNFDTLDSLFNAYEGWYVDDVQLSVAGPWTDSLAFSAAANDTVSIAFKNLIGSTANISVADTTGNLLTSPTAGAANFTAGTNDLSIPVTGTYYVQVNG